MNLVDKFARSLSGDFFILGENPFDLEEFARHRAESPLENRKIFVKSPEDTVLRKLQWYRADGEVSDRQWTDVAGILRTQGTSMDQS